MASTSSRRLESRLWPDQRSTSSSCDDTTAGKFAREGDLVLRLVQSTKGMHKLSPPWEGPFIVSRVLGNGAYYLIDAQEPRKNNADNSDKETERPWNVSLLRPFFC
jgi:hypothetical protein